MKEIVEQPEQHTPGRGAQDAPRRYRVGVICHSPSTQMSAQYDALAELDDFEVTVLFRNRDLGNAAWTPDTPERVAFEYLQPSPFPWPRNLKHRFNGNIRPLLSRYDFDVMVLHGLWDSSAIRQAVRWCRRHNRPYLYRCDGNVEKEQKSLLRSIIRRVLVGDRVQRAAGLLVIGEQNKRYYEVFGGREDQFFLAPWEFDYHNVETALKKVGAQREAIREELGLTDTVCIVTIGRLLQLKGLDTVIPVVARLSRQDGLAVHMLVGGEGPYRPALESLIKETNAPVTLCGNLDREHVVRTLVASDIFVLASAREAWGLVVNEAALCSLPMVVSHAVGAGPDLVLPDDNGFIFHAGDQERLHAIFRKLIDDPALRQGMGQRSAEILQRWRAENRAVDGYEKAFRAALSLPPREPAASASSSTAQASVAS